MRSGYKRSILWQQGERRLKNLIGYGVVILGGFLAGVFMMWLIARFGGGGVHPPKSWIPLGTILGLLVGAVVHGFVDSLIFAPEFNLAVSMGVTRRRWWLGYALFGALELGVMYLEVLALAGLERVFGEMLFGDLTLAREMAGFWEKFPVLAAAGILPLLAAELCTGALFLRFGNKVLWGIWFLAILCPNLLHRDLGRLAGPLGALPGGALWAILAGVLFTLLLTLVSAALVRKQRVTFG